MFSFICKKCEKPVICSVGFKQVDECKMFLLKNGKVIETMTGEYTGYGTCNDENGNEQEWDMPWCDSYTTEDVHSLIFNEDEDSGIAVIHKRCDDGTVPKTSSPIDPNQGWL